jgi:hypothetical protein
MSREIRNLIMSNDSKLSKMELDLMSQINDTYKEAVKAATKELMALKGIDDNKVTAEAKKILDRAGKAFQKKFETLSAPIRAAMEEAYEQGLNETNAFLALRNDTGVEV